MSETCDFISTLFQKSKTLNDMNTHFLQELEFGELSLKQKIDLFYRNTEYHENVLKSIADIVKDLDKTDVLLTPDYRRLLKVFKSIDKFTQSKVFLVIDALTTTQFIPQYLSTCPKCGGRLSTSTTSDSSCKRVPLRIGNQDCGYTYKCMNREGKNESE